MFFYDDLTREAISHFVGSFAMSLEEARARLEYLEFRAAQLAAEQAEQGDTMEALLTVWPDYQLLDLNPNIHYEFNGYRLFDDIPAALNFYEWDGIGMRANLTLPPNDGTYNPYTITLTGGVIFITYHHEVLPNSFAVLSRSENLLDDNDYLSNTGLSYRFDAEAPSLTAFVDALEAAGITGRFGFSEADNPAGNLSATVEAWAETAKAMQTGAPGVGQQVLVTGEETGQLYQNGVVVEEAARLDEVIKQLKGRAPDEDADGLAEDVTDNGPQSASGQIALLEETAAGSASLQISTGNNTMINQAVVLDVWGKAATIAVAGDYYDLDIISQTNVLASPHLAGLGALASDPTTGSYNIASILNTGSDLPVDATSIGNHALWDITFHDGDMTFVNWLTQTNYLVDNDTIVYQEDNSGTMITSGGNVLTNGLNLTELSTFFDMILIGGNYYSANVISQTNVLVNFDQIISDGTGDAPLAGPDGQIDNLLWNEAYIVSNFNNTVVDLDPVSANRLATADEDDLDSDFLSGAFSGEASPVNMLNVLYVSGDVYDINYLEQVNILGDSDSIATLGVDVASEDTSINGDSNLLYNAAVIQEASVDTVVRVGGETYSEALLYQAEILTADVAQPDEGGAHLASEAVVFLADGMLTDADNSFETVNLNQMPDEVCVDPMATMVA
ncbi:hypothetical protein FMN63_06480 [Stappia sp. BW2]|uniref:hypothetical protein n=1 Tax=Stappia sp. BW2 TaxID=2592622 RepID=UPI0011DEA08E|nr:hypothetical protein [Stappia sp. BW2]TYC75491.1 hypothetical protein FMN63_06480 [Stappia sp. BW2]